MILFSSGFGLVQVGEPLGFSGYGRLEQEKTCKQTTNELFHGFIFGDSLSGKELFRWQLRLCCLKGN